MDSILSHFDKYNSIYQIATQVSTVLIALFAFYVSVLQTFAIHRHNKKLVTPHLGGFWETDYENGAYLYTIKNNGLGPAIIKKISYTVDGEIIEGKGTSPIESILDKIIGPIHRTQSIGHFGINEYFSQHEEKAIAKLEFNKGQVDLDHIVETLSNRARLQIEYESIVGQRFTFDSRES